MLDNPNTVLYWCLRHGQRRQIAQQLGVWRAGDSRIGEVPAARLWLRRLRACGSIAQALDRAKYLHQIELWHIEETHRVGGVHARQDELAAWRDHKYRLLELAHAPADPA